jgi:hypothetical protein
MTLELIVNVSGRGLKLARLVASAQPLHGRGKRIEGLVVERYGPGAAKRSRMVGSAGCIESFQSPWP